MFLTNFTVPPRAANLLRYAEVASAPRLSQGFAEGLALLEVAAVSGGIDVGAADDERHPPAAQPLAQRAAAARRWRRRRPAPPRAWRSEQQQHRARAASSSSHQHQLVHVAPAQARSCRARRAARPGCRRWCAPRRSPAASRRRSCGAWCRRPRARRRTPCTPAASASPPPRRRRTGRRRRSARSPRRGPAPARISSRPSVAVPSAVSGPSNGCTKRAALLLLDLARPARTPCARRRPARPRRPARGSARRGTGSRSSASPPWRCVPSTLRGVGHGHRVVAGADRGDAARQRRRRRAPASR